MMTYIILPDTARNELSNAAKPRELRPCFSQRLLCSGRRALDADQVATNPLAPCQVGLSTCLKLKSCHDSNLEFSQSYDQTKLYKTNMTCQHVILCVDDKTSETRNIYWACMCKYLQFFIVNLVLAKAENTQLVWSWPGMKFQGYHHFSSFLIEKITSNTTDTQNKPMRLCKNSGTCSKRVIWKTS